MSMSQVSDLTHTIIVSPIFIGDTVTKPGGGASAGGGRVVGVAVAPWTDLSLPPVIVVRTMVG
jgi:hypothetical protein